MGQEGELRRQEVDEKREQEMWGGGGASMPDCASVLRMPACSRATHEIYLCGPSCLQGQISDEIGEQKVWEV